MIKVDIPVTHVRDHTQISLMVATRAVAVMVLVMMTKVVGVNGAPLSHRAIKVSRHLVMLIIEGPPSIQGILIEILALVLHVRRGTMDLVGRALYGVTSVVG